YAALLEGYNEAVYNGNIRLSPCAFLHNYKPDDVIRNPFYREHLDKAPIFLKTEIRQLQEFIRKYIRKGDTSKILYRIENGRIRPSKSLADSLAKMMSGNREFVMIDEQKLVYESVIAASDLSEQKGRKQVIIVEGGPGTGKSVVAINLLVGLTQKSRLVQYVTKNAAPRAVYASKLTGTLKKTHYDNLFKGSGAYVDTKPNTFDVLVVDEAHRLNEKSGMYRNLGENQVKEIIRASRTSVFFIDEDQRVTLSDIGTKDEIRQWAVTLGADVKDLELQSQFRCNGSDGYLAWLDDVLQIRETANTSLEGIDYDFRVFDNPNKLRSEIEQKNELNNKARMVAGYCWEWKSKKNANLKDVVIPEFGFGMTWNLAEDGGLWIMRPDSAEQIGCIHTCQGLELDYIGVIIGPDLIMRDGILLADPSKRARSDASIKGYKTLLKNDPETAQRHIKSIIKNTYRTLMTRGMKGCYVYCCDEELNSFLKAAL
ncbi:MAG: DNA/RNA helicase domain-containing protein, partial [Bacteroidota bacterium]